MKVIDDLIEKLLQSANENGRREVLAVSIKSLNVVEISQLTETLKERVISYLNSNARLAMMCAKLVLTIADLVAGEKIRALGLRLVAQVHLIGYGRTDEAMKIYDQAIDLYESIGDIKGRAETAITYVWALAVTGDYEEAVREGKWATEVLGNAGAKRSKATLQNNLALIHIRNGNLILALDLLEDAKQIYQTLGDDGREFFTNISINRALLLCDLGRFQESIQASMEAQTYADDFEQKILKAKISHNLGLTYMILGHYNKAIQLMESARPLWEDDGRKHEVYLCDLALTDCLLKLRRFEEVIGKCRQIRNAIQNQHQSYEAALSYLNQAEAQAGLKRFEQALESLEAGKKLFLGQGNAYWAVRTKLVTASIYQLQGRWAESEQLSLDCRRIFSELGYLVEEVTALLQAGRAALNLGDHHRVRQYAQQALVLSGRQPFSALNYQAYYLLGQAARAEKHFKEADENYRLAIQELERLQGHIMVEHRPDFMTGDLKKNLFEAAVSSSLDRGLSVDALSFVERAKSRSLLEILTHRIDLRLQAHTREDEPLVNKLNELIARRNTLYRRQERERQESPNKPLNLNTEDTRELERKIEEIRQHLLVANADYAEQVELFQTPDLNQVIKNLSEDTAVIEYFILDQRPLAFLIIRAETQIQVQIFELSVDIPELKRCHTALHTNLAAAAYGDPLHLPELTAHARHKLQWLYDSLLGRFADRLERFSKLVIVPHGLLHYLPFHAFHDGSRYLIETHQVSYLPAISFFAYSGLQAAQERQVFSVGFSYDNRLLNAVQEAKDVGGLWAVEPLLESEATLETVRDRIAACRLFHCASHGEFRADRPLFSGVALADGWLTTLDIFNLRLSASLVTLSACNTGKHVIGGGEELIGLMRAFFIAGASSLLLSHWEVNDHSTSLLMQAFYRNLQSGQTKAGALRSAQRSFLEGKFEAKYEHPFYWAPFYLVGDPGLF